MRRQIERARMLANDAARARSAADFADILVDGLWDLIPSEDVTFNEIDEQAKCVILLRTRTTLPFDDDVDDEYWAANYDDLPFCKGFGEGESGVARMSDVLARAALGASHVYRDVMWTGGLRHSIEAVFASPPSMRRAVLLGRADRDFTLREVDLLALLLPHLEDAYRSAQLRSLLTPRQREVLALVAQGHTNREIARRLDISPGTVRVHLEHTYPKLGVRSRVAAASLMGSRPGLIGRASG